MHNAILIDPYSKTIMPRTLDLTQRIGGYHALRHAVFGDGVGLICHVNLGPVPRRPGESALTLSGYVDDEGLLVDWGKQAFFRIGPAGETPPLAGRMIVVCTDEEGESVGVPEFLLPLLLERLRAIVAWLDPKDVRVPAPTFQPLGPDLRPEGEPTPLTSDGRSDWDYDHQPR